MGKTTLILVALSLVLKNFCSAFRRSVVSQALLSNASPQKIYYSHSLYAKPATSVKLHEIFMPALSSTMKEGTIVSWLKDVGDRIEMGDAVMLVESDKADMEVESFAEGYLASKLIDAGSSALVGATVGLVVENPDDIEMVAKRGLENQIPEGDNSRHDGTTAWHLEASKPAESELPDIPPEFVSESEKVESHEIFMPALSSTMTEGTITKWLVSEGDRINAGDTVMVVGSDKADMDVESFEEGYLAKIVHGEGETVKVGATTGLIAKKEEDIELVREQGIQSLASGSDRRQDGTTTVYDKSSNAKTLKSQTSHTEQSLFMPTLGNQNPRVVAWAKRVGENVKKGELLVTLESEGKEIGLFSENDGRLLEIKVKNDNAGKPGSIIGQIDLKFTEEKSKKDFNNKVPSFTPESLDQDIRTQVPADMTPKDLRNHYISTVRKSEKGRDLFDELSKTEKGRKDLDKMTARIEHRQPPSNNLLHADMPGIDTSLWRISGSARSLAKKLNISLEDLKSKNGASRIFEADVRDHETNNKKKNNQSIVSNSPLSSLPSVMKFAKEKKVDLSKVKGSGIGGRILIADVETFLGIKPERQTTSQTMINNQPTQRLPPTQPSLTPLTPIQKAIAKNMEATLSVPVFRVSMNIETDNFTQLYEMVKPKGVSFSAMYAKAVGLALRNHPLINAAFDAKNFAIKYHPTVNVAMAVATEDGLITPSIPDVNSKSLFEISRIWKDLVERAKTNNLSREEYSSGTFVISNLGMFGVSSFEAILPNGVGSILALGAPIARYVEDVDGDMTEIKEMTATITCDHRHIYGAHAALFLKELKSVVEDRTLDLLIQ